MAESAVSWRILFIFVGEALFVGVLPDVASDTGRAMVMISWRSQDYVDQDIIYISH
jgi:hypothetical protein